MGKLGTKLQRDPAQKMKKPLVLLEVHKQTLSITILDVKGLLKTKDHVLVPLVSAEY